MMCITCKAKRKQVVLTGKDGVPHLVSVFTPRCGELQKKGMKDMGDIFEEWECPDYEARE